ncbi:uncharacterized protein LTR77_006754 [Saxophila tyrrhenica]|uniref:Uncharacterized protein n=1 Tax=Saxophila tyrrhenica TaxID=1690608 RepID=A0AAV9P6A3_9PEZI|nr:hypothetical protein LTR77_006754 [Saxophila tyrrhenica]
MLQPTGKGDEQILTFTLHGILAHIGKGLAHNWIERNWHNQFNTNVWGAIRLTKAVLPHMRRRGQGTLVFMGSIAGWVGTAAGGPYSASKFALEGKRPVFLCAVECLKNETEDLGIRTHLVVLGQFRTSILGAERRQFKVVGDPSTGYDSVLRRLDDRQAATNDKQPGDPAAAAERVADLVREEGWFTGQLHTPFRLFLGSDCLEILRRKCKETLDVLEEQDAIARSTDLDVKSELEGYN